MTLYRVPMSSRHADGPRELLVNVAAAPLRTRDGGAGGTIVLLEDITSRVQLEEQLQISEKMASIGLLAAGVAHEVNTPLTGISSFTQMLLESADPDDPRTKLLEKIERQTFRAARIVNGLLNLARPAKVEQAPVDLHAVINDVLSLLEHQFRTGNVQVRKELADAAPIVLAIEHKLQQVFLNLFLNASDAMPSGGWLSITTRVEPGQIVVEIGDTGDGIQVEHLSRIYDPFFTTKPIGQGTGLGLSITYGIVRDHGGVITCESGDGKGTVFRLTFPVAGSLGKPADSPGRDRHGRQTGSLVGLMTRQGAILVIDDEEIMREILETLLVREGYQVRLASTGAEGVDLARSMPFDAAIVDIMMPGKDGISTLDDLKTIDDDLPIVMVTAFASIETAIAAMKRGALDYITKPFKNDEVLVVLRNALERRQLVSENRALRQNLQTRYHKFANIIGRSPRMRQVFDLIIQAAPSRSTVLVNGESGTGKELVARALHTNSPRAERQFVTVNSGNLPPDLLESNLFGHVKGAFTGAVYPKKGLFEIADKGSIFFDEIGNVPIETQAKLLRVIQEREFMRLGGVENIKVDVRIIAATNVDLRRMMEEGRFREDLYYRLHVITIQLPALRERKEDIPLLAQHFLGKYGEENGKIGMELTPDALDLLMEYRLARERARARERDRAGRRPVPRHPHRPRAHPGARAHVAAVPDSDLRRPAGRHFVQGSHERLREAPDRVDARGGGRRAEARGRAAAHQADHAQRDDQAVRHPPAAQEGERWQRCARPRARDCRGRGNRRTDAGVIASGPISPIDGHARSASAATRAGDRTCSESRPTGSWP